MSPARPRIAFLLPDMRGGGAERVALTLMGAFVDQGHEVDLVLANAAGELLPLVPPQVRRFDLGARRLRNAVVPLVRYLRDRRPDALQVSMWPLTVIGILAAKIARVPTRVVVSEHIVLSEQYGRNKTAMSAIRVTTRLFYPLASARVAVSSGAADDLSRLSGMDRDRLEVVYNPVQAPADIRTTPEVERLWGADGFRILTVGSLKEQKNHLLLLDAFAQLPDQKARLMIVGDGPLRPLIESHAAQLGVAERTIMPGFTADPWPYYASADLFVLSSDYEGFGNVIVEAMHAGLPIVSTNCPSGPSEILGDGEFGRLVPVGNADLLRSGIAAACSDPPAPDRQKQRAADFSAEPAVAEYLRLLAGPVDAG